MEVFTAHELTEHLPAQFRCSQSSRDTDARDQWTRRDTLLTSVTGGVTNEGGAERGSCPRAQQARGAKSLHRKYGTTNEYDRVWWIS